MRTSKKSKWLILMSFLVSAALIATVTLYAITINRKGALLGAEMWFIIGLIALAAITFGLFAWFRLHKSKYVKKLNSQYFEAYEKFCDAIAAAKMSRTEIREIKQDVLVLLLDAQQQGRSQEEVIGQDISEFAKRVQSSFGYRSSFLFEICSLFQYGIFFVTFIQVLLYFSNLGQSSFFSSEISLSLAVMFIPIIFVIYPLLRRAMRNDKTTVAMLSPIIYGVVFILIIILLDNVFGYLAWVRFFLDTQIVMISSLWQLIVMAAVFAAAQAIKWYLRRRSVRELNEWA